MQMSAAAVCVCLMKSSPFITKWALEYFNFSNNKNKRQENKVPRKNLLWFGFPSFFFALLSAKYEKEYCTSFKGPIIIINQVWLSAKHANAFRWMLLTYSWISDVVWKPWTWTIYVDFIKLKKSKWNMDSWVRGFPNTKFRSNCTLPSNLTDKINCWIDQLTNLMQRAMKIAKNVNCWCTLQLPNCNIAGEARATDEGN